MSDLFSVSDVNAINPEGAQPAHQGGVFDDSLIASVGQKAASVAPPAAPHEGLVGNFLHGAASLADTVLGAVPGTLNTAAYATLRAIGDTPEQATNVANQFSEPFSRPIGKALGITDTPGYKNEVSNEVQQFIGQNLDKGADWLAQKTGLPKQDIANMAASLTLAIPAVVKGIKGAANIAGQAALDTAADDTNLGTQKPTAYESARATYANEPATASAVSQFAPGGAAGSSLSARLSVASDALKADAEAQIASAKQQYGADWSNHVHWDALNRQLNADSLPVPGRLTAGQATGNGALISDEWNKRSVNGLGPTFASQNENQIANLQAIREQATPDVYTNTPADHAQTLIDAYKELHAKETGVIDQKWNAIRAQSGDRPIFDANQMLADAQAALKKELLSSKDPGGQLAELMDAARTRGGLSADGYNAFRQNLGKTAMEGGTEGKAASVVIKATNKSDLLPEASSFRDSVNDALATGRALHAKLADDPAYNAVAEGNASVKDFINKFVINAKPENVAKMTGNLVGNDVANQTMRAAVLDHLRGAAALDEQYHGNFAAKSFNKNLSNITPVARTVFNDGELQTLRSLGDYSNHISQAGRDSWKNYSNTATEQHTPANAMASQAGKIIGTGAEAALAHHTGGISIPIIGTLKEGFRARAAMKAALEEQDQAAQYLHDTTRPAAGIIK